MSFDAWVVGFGLSRITIDLGLIESPSAYSIWLAVVLIDTFLLLAFFAQRRAQGNAPVILNVFERAPRGVSFTKTPLPHAELEPVLIDPPRRFD